MGQFSRSSTEILKFFLIWEFMNDTILIKSSNVFDGISFVGRKEILVRDGKIVNVGNGISCKNVIDLGDMFISPGFIDAHIHFGGFKFDEFAQSFVYERDESLLLSCIPSLKKVLDSGFTTVRACGGKYDIHLRDAVKAGYIDGPDIIAAGNALTQTFGHGELSHTLPVELVDGYFGKVCDGVPECIKATRTVLRDGADFIKIITTGGALSQGDSPDNEQFTLEEVRAIVNEARKVGTYVAAHAEGDPGIRIAMEGGVSFIEHGSMAKRETIKLMAEKGISLTPTLSVFKIIEELSSHGNLPRKTGEKITPILELAGSTVTIARDMGVNIMTGTDIIGPTGTQIDYGSNWMEIVLLSEMGGLSQLEALRTATGNCVALGKKIGRIESGFKADIIGIDGNPLENIRDASKVSMVMKSGKVVKMENGQSKEVV